MHSAAIVLPLFSLRSETDLGRGEIPALATLAAWMDRIGHRVLQLLPLSEPAPGEASPYSAFSVLAIDPLYIGVAALAGVAQADYRRAQAQVAGRPSLPRDQLCALKFPLLKAAFEYFRRHGNGEERDGFEDFVAANRQWLEDYVLFRALKERFHWASWESWPPALARREPAALAAVAEELEPELAMYRYWQFLAWRQWRELTAVRAATHIRLSGDLAFCPARDSADVWSHQELFDLTCSVGAPPDSFSLNGQRWGLPLPDWKRMAADDFRWWRMRARQIGQMFDLVRIDHVVGFYRTYFFADAEDAGRFVPAQENEQLAQGERLLAVLQQELGHDALIAEDLGAVPPWVRASLTRLGIPGLKVFRWEREHWGQPDESLIPPGSFPELSVAVTGTHDTEPLASWWRDAPLSERRQVAAALSFPPHLELTSGRLEPEVLDAILAALYRAPSRLTMVPWQDLFGLESRINVPGTIGGQNWRYRMPVTVERLAVNPAMVARSAQLRRLAELGGRA